MATIARLSRYPRRLMVALVAAIAVASSCLEWERGTSNETQDIRAFITGVVADGGAGAEATYGTGSPPAAGAGDVLAGNVPAIVLRGGAALVTFTSATAFSRVIVSVTDPSVTGYFDLVLPAAVTSATVLIIYAQEVGASAFTMTFAGGVADVLGPFTAANTSFLGNGTGEVQVNITWNSAADVDLYVVDPLGEEIYYGDRSANSGGELDIDSNAGCGSDGPRSENIYWPFGIVAPRGNYVVRVNYWSACQVASTEYVVTIRTTGGVPVVYTGVLTGAGVGGGAGAGTQIATFTY